MIQRRRFDKEALGSDPSADFGIENEDTGSFTLLNEHVINGSSLPIGQMT